MTSVLVLASLLCLGHALDLTVTPPPNQWVGVDQENVALLCKVSGKINSCSWTTPYDVSYPLGFGGLKTEKGRLTYKTEDEHYECGLVISKIESRDEGKWKCNVGHVTDTGEVTSASGITQITIAEPPTTVQLLAPFNQKMANISRGMTTEIACEVSKSKPAPVFRWLVGDDEMVLKDLKKEDMEVFVDDMGLSTYTQTLTYTPNDAHTNKTIRCVVEHVGLAEELSAEVLIHLHGDAPTWTRGPSIGTNKAGLTAGVVIAVLIIVILGVVAFFIIRRKLAQRAEANKELPDEEKGELVEVDKTSQTESAQEKEETEEKKEAEEKKEEPSEEITENKEEEIETKPAQSYATRIRGLFSNMFSKKTQEKTELEEVKEKEVSEEKEVPEEKKMEEIEPEDKEEKPVEEKRKGSETPV